VAATIAGGLADAGFGIEAAATQFGLAFIPLVSERYFLACRKELVEQPAVQKIIELLRSPKFRAVVSELPGYEAPEAGNTMNINDLFATPPASNRELATSAAGNR